MFRKMVSSPKFRSTFEVDEVLEGDDRSLLEFGLKWLAFSCLEKIQYHPEG